MSSFDSSFDVSIVFLWFFCSPFFFIHLRSWRDMKGDNKEMKANESKSRQPASMKQHQHIINHKWRSLTLSVEKVYIHPTFQLLGGGVFNHFPTLPYLIPLHERYSCTQSIARQNLSSPGQPRLWLSFTSSECSLRGANRGVTRLKPPPKFAAKVICGRLMWDNNGRTSSTHKMFFIVFRLSISSTC